MTSPEINIPDKVFFKIGEVSKLIGVEPYVLRFWETEFPEIKPSKTNSWQRLYKRADAELIWQIKRLLHNQNYTIKGARQALSQFKKPTKTESHNQKQIELGLDDTPPSKGLSATARQELESIIHEMGLFVSEKS